MKYGGTLIAVSNIEVSKQFYQEVFGLKSIFDIGPHVSFEGGLSLQLGYAELVGFDKNEMVMGSKSFQLYFEEEELDCGVPR